MKHFAVIPTHNRPDDLAELLRSIPPSVHVLVIDNASDPTVQFSLPLEFLGRRLEIKRDDEQPPNLSRLWNLGLQWAEDMFSELCKLPVEPGDEWAVTILNDDVVLPKGFLGLMADEMINHNVDIAFPGAVGSPCFKNTRHPFPGVGLRITGWCFTVRGSSGLRADERLRWWCGDDDLQAAAVRTGRGTVAVRMPKAMAEGLRHKHPDESTRASSELRAQTEIDMATFVKKWGRRPW